MNVNDSNVYDKDVNKDEEYWPKKIVFFRNILSAELRVRAHYSR